MRKQKIELKFTDTSDVHFKAPLYCYMLKVDDETYNVWNEKLSIKGNASSLQEACEIIKDIFLDLARDIEHKSKHAALSQREREKLEVIRSICSL